jgi:hypothetical protein
LIKKIPPICGLLEKTFASAQSTNKRIMGAMGAINTKHLHHFSTLYINRKITVQKKIIAQSNTPNAKQ